MKKIYLLALTLVSAMSFGQVVISQVYGGGGNASATYTNDFVELYNKGAASVDISGWSVQYASATGTAWAVNAIPAASSIGAGKYFLVKLAGSTVGIALPTPDADITTSPSNLSGTAGKVALVNNITALSGAVVTTGYIDLLGYGSTATSSETAIFSTTGTNNTISFQRGNNGCNDTNNNSTDFALGSVNPRNSSVAAYSCTVPTISITSPANATIFSPETTTVNVVLSVNNFNVANGTGNGHIHYTINGGATVMKYDTTPIAVPTTPGSYTVYVELVDNTHTPIVPAKNATVTFTVASYTNAATLAAVRAAGINAWVNYTGTSVVSFSRPLTGGRNQKYIQDATAGILVDDSAGLITTPFVIGDGISNIKGQLINFSGVMEFVPNQDATKPSTGNTITPQVVSLATIAGNIDAYESQLVQINGVNFTAADGTAVFVVNTDTAINDGTASLFRPMFPATEVDYIGAVIPTGARNIAVIVSENTGVLKVVARSLAELTLSRSSFDAISGLKIYPNPAKNLLNITSDSFETKTVAIYNVLGAQVLAANVTNAPINVASLSKGVYVVKVTEEGKTATRKLVIE
ncbi:T9SS type A sorting domain-containing protein [Flavobacterium sp.]|uniref:T9SS type A sorting domain-containing protein n=1 Tax=Flavobacterium sp. TaxID=239 RepID=UPI0038FC080F